MTPKFTVELKRLQINREDILRHVSTRTRSSFTPRLIGIVEIAKSMLLDAFNDHPVTKEIDSGIKSENTSGTLNGEGNLFSFIGFFYGDNPTELIRKAFEEIKLEVNGAGSNIEYTIVYPSAEVIFAKYSPMPWATGRSWARGIERGIPGLAYYLYPIESDKSRSTAAFQIESKLRGGKFKNVKYITELIKNFEKQIVTEIKRLNR